MLRIVLDTNVLVAAAYAPGSASRQIVESVLAGSLQAVLSPALRREYEHILGRALKNTGYEERLAELIAAAAVVEPTEVPRVVTEDRDDDQVIAAAVAGAAAAIVTADRHLLPLDGHAGICIVTAGAFVARFLQGNG